MSNIKTEDQVRDEAKIILQFDQKEKNIKQGTGQITTFNQLGFKGVSDKPDGWYLPDNVSNVAIILETKAEDKDISKQSFIDELFKNLDIVSSKYTKIIGILYNGNDVLVYKGKQKIQTAKTLQPKQYYIDLFKDNTIDKNRIYSLTKKINDLLHFKFGIKNLYHRMIFTASALIVERFGGNLNAIKNNGYEPFRNKIYDTLAKSLQVHRQQNLKIDILLEVYSEIRVNIVENQNDINSFIDYVIEISQSVNSDNWNGEDVMGIFFNEFNRYKKKSESGQVFTPEHITSFMYDLLNVSYADNVLDAACGSGAFLVKTMAKMLKEVGGNNTTEAEIIKQKKLYGIEFDREIFALACANMLIHKDGKTNLVHLDTRENQACEWIKSKPITKVLMNPPYERKYGCKKIVENVLKNVAIGTKCAFILPDKKLEKDKMRSLLKNHTLEMIIKLPENLFDSGVTTSIFVFEVGKPQNNKQIFACYMVDDGLERVKNQGRHDIKNRWADIEQYWLNVVIRKVDEQFQTHQWLNPKEHLSYQKPQQEFEIFKEDFKKVIFDYILFEQGIDVKTFNENLLNKVLYQSNVENAKLVLNLQGADDE
ncbi:type I restriction-modification system DNA methylase subunit [Volucribacter psittacicida]|uniref:site-specific DNA-methyltransferase (adenine-specific) n=1 Tax=Volucribacter psittacicida TaxID=203482 RepID=A0A4R1G4W4_9PAST|nr:N-6 DNA methylase [Volucribacter psittacicida]TCK01821.1 type I restriction-modification system DNA methylase subunit [Volucribacter psittacicida]